MATLKLKNKYEVSFNKLVSAAKKSGGIPSTIDVSVKEARDILKEINEVHSSVFVVDVAQGAEDPRFMMKNLEDIEIVKQLLIHWWDGDFNVYFWYGDMQNAKIPIKIINLPKSRKDAKMSE